MTSPAIGAYLDHRAAIAGDALAALDADVSPAAAVACYLTAALAARSLDEQRALLVTARAHVERAEHDARAALDALGREDGPCER